MSRSFDLARVFADEGPRLRRFLRRFGPAVSAEDIAQDAFERLHAAAPGEMTSPRAFLYRTARNLAINAWKRETTAPVRGAEFVPAEAASSDLDPEEQVLLGEAMERLRQALAGLPERQRRALLLFKAEGRSYKEIATQLCVSPRTVERYVADAIAHCHRELRDLRED